LAQPPDSRFARRRRQLRHQLIWLLPYLAGGGILIILPLFLPSYFQIVATKILIYALLAMSLDVIYGYAGLFSMGHAACFGVGGYTVGLLMVRYGVGSVWLGAPLAVLTATLVAALFGLIVLRVSGVYFLLVTFALGEVLVSVATKWKFLSTHPSSTEGVLTISPPDLGLLEITWDAATFYYFVLTCFAISFCVLWRFLDSPFGHALQGIRESEARMRALGYNTWFHKYVAFVVAGLFAGGAGVLVAYHDGFMVPASFGVTNSALAILMVIIGGPGTLYGPALGAAVIILVELFASMYIPDRWPLILGASFILAVMYAREGLAVPLAKLWRRTLVAWMR
jgi:branched-chain amino acid transport system permease protein